MDLRAGGSEVSAEKLWGERPHRQVGGNAVAAKKPDAGHLRAVLERLGVLPGRAVMVGDRAHDLAAARALGVPCVLVSFGYTPTPAHALGGDLVIDRFDELPAALQHLAELAA